MGFDVKTFYYILEGPQGFALKWDSAPIPQNDVSVSGRPRLGARSLDAAGALGLVLHHLSSSMLDIRLQQIFALIPTTVSRYINFAKSILLKTVKNMKEAQVHFPRTLDEYQANTDLLFEHHLLLYGAMGSIDGLGLAAQEADDPEVENATYNGWKSSHFINNILVFSPQGVIIGAELNAPGSWHDSHVARPIYEILQTEVPEGFYLVADTAFPHGAALIAGKICAPLKGGEYIPADPEERPVFSGTTANFCHTNRLQNGECV